MTKTQDKKKEEVKSFDEIVKEIKRANYPAFVSNVDSNGVNYYVLIPESDEFEISDTENLKASLAKGIEVLDNYIKELNQ